MDELTLGEVRLLIKILKGQPLSDKLFVILGKLVLLKKKLGEPEETE